ncbi:MAG: Uma2 family endonuclease [Bacteroidota bacterium]
MSIDIINQLMQQPDAPTIVEEVHSLLEKERQERLAFYNWVIPSVKAEFINGEIIVHSPVIKRHNDANGRLYKIISDYVDEYDLGFCGIEKIMISLTRNDYEPDVVFFDKTKSDHFEEEKNRFPAPDLIVEVLSKGTAKRDRGVKFKDYALHGVEEYWIVDAKKQLIEQYELKSSEYVKKHELGKGDTITSFVIKGLTFSVAAVFDKEAYKMARQQLKI